MKLPVVLVSLSSSKTLLVKGGKSPFCSDKYLQM